MVVTIIGNRWTIIYNGWFWTITYNGSTITYKCPLTILGLTYILLIPFWHKTIFWKMWTRTPPKLAQTAQFARFCSPLTLTPQKHLNHTRKHLFRKQGNSLTSKGDTLGNTQLTSLTSKTPLHLEVYKKGEYQLSMLMCVQKKAGWGHPKYQAPARPTHITITSQILPCARVIWGDPDGAGHLDPALILFFGDHVVNSTSSPTLLSSINSHVL